MYKITVNLSIPEILGGKGFYIMQGFYIMNFLLHAFLNISCVSPASPLLVSTYQVVGIFHLKVLQILGWPIIVSCPQNSNNLFGQPNILKQWLGPLVIYFAVK